VGSLELDLTNRTVRRGDRSLDLLPREFRLLEYMMRRQNQILTRAMLLEEVWHYKFVPERTSSMFTWENCVARSTGQTKPR
jgi:two-component system OmpR family response regulator